MKFRDKQMRKDNLAIALFKHLGCSLEDALEHAETIIKFEEANGNKHK